MYWRCFAHLDEHYGFLCPGAVSLIYAQVVLLHILDEYRLALYVRVLFLHPNMGIVFATVQVLCAYAQAKTTG